MDDKELQQWVERISSESFGKRFRHQAVWNGRLRSTGGRYFTKSHHIEISRKYFEVHGQEETEKVIKHELCHYHLHLEKRGYQHRDTDFKELLSRVGGTRFCKPLSSGEDRRRPYRYLLVCTSCKLEYKRKRRVDPRRYVCGRCRGKLMLVPIAAGLESGSGE